MTTKRETYEVFRYRVVYPGGTFLRISPATDAEKTGAILEFGAVFDASKSLFLDGINYAKLSDGSGWVFERKNDVQILELLQIIRVPCKTLTKENSNDKLCLPVTEPAKIMPQSFSTLVGNRAGIAESAPNSLLDKQSNSTGSPHSEGILPAQRQQAKVENRLWRDVRARCGTCGTFEEFLQLVTTLKISIEGLHSQHEQRVLDSITLIESITGQCSAHMVKQGRDLVGVGACLWVLVHMGSRVSHTMALIVESANQIFEAASSAKKANLLRVVLEVGTRTKSHAADLARQVDILPDDIRNFLQRWIIVQSLEEVKESILAIEEEDSPKGEQQNRPKKVQGQYGSCSNESLREEFRVRSTPVDDLENIPRSGRWAMSLPTVTSWFNSNSSSSSNFLPICSPRGRIGSDLDESDRPLLRDSQALKTGSSMDQRRMSRGRGVPLESDRGWNAPQSLSTIVWNEVKKQAEKFSDTDMQLAGLI